MIRTVWVVWAAALLGPPLALAEVVCSSDADCPATAVCEGGRCESANCGDTAYGITAGADCASSSDCPAGFQCQSVVKDDCPSVVCGCDCPTCFEADAPDCTPCRAKCLARCEADVTTCEPTTRMACVWHPDLCQSDADCATPGFSCGPKFACKAGVQSGACGPPEPEHCLSAADCDPGLECAAVPAFCRCPSGIGAPPPLCPPDTSCPEWAPPSCEPCACAEHPTYCLPPGWAPQVIALLAAEGRTGIDWAPWCEHADGNKAPAVADDPAPARTSASSDGGCASGVGQPDATPWWLMAVLGLLAVVARRTGCASRML